MREELNQRLTRIGPGTPAGALLRQYWQPVALLDEFDAALDARMEVRPLKTVRLLGEDFVLFRDEDGRFGLLDRHCPHRGADLCYGRLETRADSRWGEPAAGLRCPFHGWKFDASGQCIETPGEPKGSTLHLRINAGGYPLRAAAGVLFAWLGGGDAPALPALDVLAAPGTHTFAFKGLWRCNWLQATEVGIDPAHTSFLHAFFEDASLELSYGRQFRSLSDGDVDGEQWPMTRILREFHRPRIDIEPTDCGQRLVTTREIDANHVHVRVTHGLFPHGFVIPLSTDITITQFHVPVDDMHTYWYSLFTSYAAPLDRETMRAQRLAGNPAPDFAPLRGRHDHWGYDPHEQATRTMLGMGEDDINVHDQWACESMGAIADRRREHLGTTDRAIIEHRRALRAAMDAVEAGDAAPRPTRLEAADTWDGIAPRDDWRAHWQRAIAERRASTRWLRRPSNSA